MNRQERERLINEDNCRREHIQSSVHPIYVCVCVCKNPHTKFSIIFVVKIHKREH
ncbi:unnamed protein product [Chironomus riparius]|uniref:Uncharacterized protein n=1 Tax=Chironomus riparius TaxID=315576 RepID=A0A9N9WRA6_9DIPT|nr:unnamed protein product [Chironomus riparius]